MARTKLLTVAATSLLVAACAVEAPDESSQAPQVEPQVSAAGIQIEQAERQLDRGGDPRQALVQLRVSLADSAITAAERRSAILALSRAHEAADETDQAIAVIESEMAAHADDRAWEGEPFKRRLRALLTGSDTAPGSSMERDEPVAPFAHVVAKSFPTATDGAVKATFFIAGGNRDLSAELGTFNIRGALEAEQEEACPLCERHVNVGQSISRSDWMVIPEQQAHFGDALLVFYYDLGRNRIPARYERHLPLTVAEIEAELEQGKSFVVASERAGAPPSLLLAAPRTAQLEDVERYLSGLQKLPTEITYADASSKLRPAEIRSVVRRHWFGKLRKCYESLLERAPTAGGKLMLSFRIAGDDGSVSELELTPQSDAISDETFLGCLMSGAEKMQFPATGKGATTVRYPLSLTP